MRGVQLDQLHPIWWEDDGLSYIDQRFLPLEVKHARAADVGSVVDAIVTSAVAGARCVDIFGGFGVVFARRRPASDADANEAVARLRTAAAPRAHGLDAIERVFSAPRGAELAEALAILEENQNIDRSIAEHGLVLLPARGAVLTHAGTGALSTGGYGTAVGAIVAAHRSGKRLEVYVSETRPLLTGMRLAAFELSAAGVNCTVFPDGAAAALMNTVPFTAVIVGAAAMAANGDALAEIGTYGIALAAAHHRIPFYVTVPRASIDPSTRRGDAFEIAHATVAARTAMLSAAGAHPDQAVLTALWDVTPGHLVTAIITEYGITRPPYYESLPSLATRPRFEFTNRRA